MPTYLDQILAHTTATVHRRKAAADMAQMEQQAATQRPRGFRSALQAAAAHGPAIIAELKKASPSKGLLRADYHPAATARRFEQTGAAALSVLTDEEFFQGSLSDLESVSKTVSIPVLRKDFIVDPFQILEARAAGADAILLIVAAHTDADLRALSSAARARELDVLCEVHDREELNRAVNLGFEMIGVNCRDLKTLEVHTERHAELAASLPAAAVRVAESGIRTPKDIQALLGVGYNAFLIGETLMREPDPGAMLASLLGRTGLGRTGVGPVYAGR